MFHLEDSLNYGFVEIFDSVSLFFFPAREATAVVVIYIDIRQMFLMSFFVFFVCQFFFS
jgi:hypothetical protein